MGTDTPLAVLSDQPQLLFNYFKQLFAQVTNPPIDPIREEIVMSLETTIGAEHNLFDETPEHCRAARARSSPILTNEELAQIKELDDGALRDRHAADALPRRATAATGCETALDELCARALATRSPTACTHPHPVRPRRRRATTSPIPSLLATGGRAPPPDPRGHAHALRHRRRVRRAARGAALRLLARLRRRRGEPVPRVRDAARAWSAEGILQGRRRRRGGRATTSRPSTRACSR